MEPRIGDGALVARGGRNQPADIERGTNVHPSGVLGVSEECASGLSLNELCASIPHNTVGVTTVGKVRDAGAPDELLAKGEVEYSTEEQLWVARIDWSAIKRASELGVEASKIVGGGQTQVG